MSRSLELLNISGIQLLGRSGRFISTESLREDRPWERLDINPHVGLHNVDDELVLRVFAWNRLPLTIGALNTTVLNAQLERFENMHRGFMLERYALRLSPDSGRLAVAFLRCGGSPSLNQSEISLDRIALDLGNGSVYLEIYMTPVNHRNLPELRQPQL